jgi:hypothetical protein
VDELHLIENKQDMSAIILLTSSAGGVKTLSFFDSFQDLRGGGRLLQRTSEGVTGQSGTETSGGHAPTARGKAASFSRKLTAKQGSKASQRQDGIPKRSSAIPVGCVSGNHFEPGILIRKYRNSKLD